MSVVTDTLGRTFVFNQIRFNMDEELLQQAAMEVLDNTRRRGQLLFDRYCQLHRQKYHRNFDPGHFTKGQTPDPAIRISLDVVSGPLFEKYVGLPVEEIEAAVKRDPRAWLDAACVVVVET